VILSDLRPSPGFEDEWLDMSYEYTAGTPNQATDHLIIDTGDAIYLIKSRDPLRQRTTCFRFKGGALAKKGQIHIWFSRCPVGAPPEAGRAISNILTWG
jgi:hypothetical protein